MKKVLTLVIAVVLTLSAVVGGTIAYLSSTDSDVNVMTVGNVKIEQHELQRADGVAHNATLKKGDLVEVNQAQKLYPAYAVDSTAYTAEATDLLMWGPYVYTGTAGNGLWNDTKLIGAMDRFIFVENTGRSDCYFRTWIALECPEGMEYSEGSDKEFMMNTSSTSRYEWEMYGYEVIDGTRYLIMLATNVQVLPAGAQSHPSLLQVVMTHNATNEDAQAIGDTYEILSFTQAVQVENLPDAKTALVAAFGNAHPWSSEAPRIPAVVDTADEFVEAFTAGKDIVLNADIRLEDQTLVIKNDENKVINLNGKTLEARNTSAATSKLIEVKAGSTLTLTGGGLVSSVATAPDTAWGEGYEATFPGYASNTIVVSGTLIVDGATIENKTPRGGASYAVDCYAGANLIVNSGEIKQTGGDVAIRMFNGGTGEVNVTINGGKISGYRAVWVQLASNKPEVAPKMNLTVNGGELTSIDPTYKQAIYVYSYGNSQANTNIALNGGTYYGDVALGGGVKTATENLTVNAANCTFYGGVYSYNTQATLPSVTADGVFAPVPSTDDMKESLQDTIADAIKSDATNIVVDANGAKMDLNYGIKTSLVPAGTTVTIANANVTAKSYGNAVDGTVVFKDCTFSNPNGAYSVHFDAGNGHVVFENCILEGWCSFGSAIQSVEMNNCTLRGNGIYALNRFYQTTTFNNCTIDMSNAPHDDNWADGISAVSDAVVTLNNCNIVYADYEVSGNGKIIVDGAVVAESHNDDEYVLIKNEDR